MKREMLRVEHACYGAAVKDFCFAVYQQEIVVVTGLSDSGVTCIKKVLDGQYKLDSGNLWINGRRAPLSALADHEYSGVFALHPHSSLAEEMTVEDNLSLYQGKYFKSPIINKGAMKKQAETILKEMEVHISPATKVVELPPFQRRVVELLKAISSHSSIILLEDIWRNFSSEQIDELFILMRKLRDNCGMSFVLITQRFEEVEGVCDRIVIMREGSNTKNAIHGELTREKVYDYMAGQPFKRVPFIRQNCQPFCSGEPTLVIHELRGQHLSDLTISAYSGEILCLVDYLGYQIREFIQILMGKQNYTGNILLCGKTFRPKSRQNAAVQGLCMILADDHGQLYERATWPENICMMNYLGRKRRRDIHSPFLSKRLLQLVASEYGPRMDGLDPTKTLEHEQMTPQQKINLVFLRWLHYKPYVLICENPLGTEDVMLREITQSCLRMLADSGICVILLSSHEKELEGLCDRVIDLSPNIQVKKPDGAHTICRIITESDI